MSVKKLQVTPVFARNWAAINEMMYDSEGRPVYDEHGRHRHKYKYIINTGSSRSSKTFSLIDCFDFYARLHRGKRLTVWRDTKTDCVKTVGEDITRHFQETRRWLNGFKYHETKSIYQYLNTSKIELHGTDDEVTVHGLNQNAAWINEPYKVSKSVFDQIDQRTTDFIVIDWNPREAHWVDDLSKDPRAIVIHSDFRDNPFCPPEQRAKILSYQPVKRSLAVEQKLLTEAEAREYPVSVNPANLPEPTLTDLMRCQDNERKRSASEYMWSVYGLGEKAERPNRIFHWQEIALPDYQALDVPTYYYSDWGAVDPWAIGEVKYYDGALYARELNYDSENTIRGRVGVTERSQIGEEENGIVSWMFTNLGIPYDSLVLCDNNRPMKILSLREAGWEYAVAVEKAGRSVIDGIDLLNNLRVYYTSDSTNIRYEQENYSRKVDRYGIVLEEPEDINNHHMDGIRYVGNYLQLSGVITKI